MSCNDVWIDATPEQVFAVLDDGWSYAKWVVGTRRIRAVDPEWPEPGSAFHHAVGTFATELQDNTRVLEHDRPRRLRLHVRFRPGGTAEVDLDVTPERGGSRCVMREELRSGPVARLPRPVGDALLWVRNAISLQRLRHEIERRAERDGT